MNKKLSQFKAVRFFRSSTKTVIGIILILVVFILCFGADIFTSIDPITRFENEYHSAPSGEHILGTTRLGRDVWSQTLYGGQKSILVGMLAGCIAVALSLFFGISSGYIGGVYDGIISTIVNIIMVIPQIVLLLVIAALLGNVSPFLISLVIGLTSWPYNARVLRAQTMSIRNREYIYSAETLGESKFRILFVEIMPNMLSMISSAFVGTLIYAIMAHATIEFIGFGDPLSVTWGIMLFNAQKSGALNSGIWWEVLGPIAGLVILGTGLTMINFSIDELSNPKLKAQRIMKYYYKVKKQQARSDRKKGQSKVSLQGGGLK
ncbi:MAG: peptide transporter permease [Herbinix sp.]|jgi:peptide/nickel transport system permease protein|nr:peptide transporter permease [Herbinix sp.]